MFLQSSRLSRHHVALPASRLPWLVTLKSICRDHTACLCASCGSCVGCGSHRCIAWLSFLCEQHHMYISYVWYGAAGLWLCVCVSACEAIITCCSVWRMRQHQCAEQRAACAGESQTRSAALAQNRIAPQSVPAGTRAAYIQLAGKELFQGGLWV